jgi:hypothetical protein
MIGAGISFSLSQETYWSRRRLDVMAVTKSREVGTPYPFMLRRLLPSLVGWVSVATVLLVRSASLHA